MLVDLIEQPQQGPQRADAALEPVAGSGEPVGLECELRPEIRCGVAAVWQHHLLKQLPGVGEIGQRPLAPGGRIAVPAAVTAMRSSLVWGRPVLCQHPVRKVPQQAAYVARKRATYVGRPVRHLAHSGHGDNVIE